jgi:hypothetical protein
MTADPNAPPGGNDGGKEKPEWEKAGFESEQAMVEAAKAVTDLRGKIAEAEAALTKERAARSKTDSEFMRQAQEIGDLRKKLKVLEKTPGAPPDNSPDESGADKEKTDDEILESVSLEEAAVLDAALNDPAQAELKKQVALGGKKAMAEFVKAFRVNSPVDLRVSLFDSLKKKRTETVPLSSIASKVKALFNQQNEEERSGLAAVPPGGAPPDKFAKAKKQMQTGGVDVSFFAAKKE